MSVELIDAVIIFQKNESEGVLLLWWWFCNDMFIATTSVCILILGGFMSFEPNDDCLLKYILARGYIVG